MQWVGFPRENNMQPRWQLKLCELQSKQAAVTFSINPQIPQIPQIKKVTVRAVTKEGRLERNACSKLFCLPT